MKKILAFDLDGTILDEYGRLSSVFCSYLEQLKSRDYLVTFITGRNPFSVKSVVGDAGLSCPISCSNGAVLMDAVSGEILEKNCFPESSLNDILSLSDKIGIEALEFQLEDKYVFSLDAYNWVMDNLPYVLPGAAFVPDNEFKELSHMSFKFDVLGSIHRINEFYNEVIKSSYDFELVKGSISTSLEITPAGINKGYGLERLCDICMVPVEASILIGDSYNDVSMFRKAGISYAMGNAPDEVKKEADIVSPFTGLDSLRWILDHILSE